MQIRFTIHVYPARGHAMGHGGSVDCSEHGARVRVLRQSDAEQHEISTERSCFIDSLVAKYRQLTNSENSRDGRNDAEFSVPAQEKAA